MSWPAFLTGVFVGGFIPLVFRLLVDFKDYFFLYLSNPNNKWYQAAGKAFREIELFN
jgi:hypothetical protein